MGFLAAMPQTLPEHISMGEGHKIVSAILPTFAEEGFFVVSIFVTTCDGHLLVWMFRPWSEIFIQTTAHIAAVRVAEITEKLALTASG